MADQYTLQKSLQEDSDDYNFQNKQFTYVSDSNSGSYNQGGQVVIELSQVANNNKWLDTNQSYISVPLVTTLFAAEGEFPDSPENAFAVSLKNGHTSLISSLQVECTNNSVVSVTSYSNVMMHHKLITSMSREDELNYGSSIGFAKDSVDSISYEATPSTKGLGECNNSIKSSVFNPTSGYGKSDSENKGRLERMKTSSYDPSMTGESVSSLAATGKPYCQRVGKNLINYYSIGHVPMSLLSDFLAEFPLCKNMFLKLTINFNSNCSTTMNVNDEGQYTSVSSSSQNGVVPFMISPTGQGNGLNIGGANPVKKLELSMGIARNQINGSGQVFSHPTLSSCRAYCCMYDMTPQAESMYLAKIPTKLIKYNDFLSFQTLNIGVGANFNQILTNSIAKGRRLIGVPMIAAAYNTAGSSGTIAPMNSPFTSSPNTTSASPLTNFNVMLSGTNLYQQNLNYSSEHFIQEIRSQSLNGCLSLGMSSGLISQLEYEAGYRFIVSDISRSPSKASDNVSKSVQVIGTNSGKYPIDIFWFLEFSREVEIDIATGSLIA
jgi:hypothetical protein